MSCDEKLDARITEAVAGMNWTRKKMFGGTCYLLNGNMRCGVYQEYLILRLEEELGREALKEAQVKSFDITGRQMSGWVMVTEKDSKGPQLREWIEKARHYVETLPPQ